jgi:hypothetical protein
MSQDEAAFLLVKETRAGKWDPAAFAAFSRLLSAGRVVDQYAEPRLA